MSSKILTAVVLALGLIGCSHENKPSNPPLDVALKGERKCLTDFASHLSLYFEGRASRDEVETFWSCLDQSVFDFSRLTVGSDSTEYSSEAVRRFLQRYFIKDVRLDSELMQSLMQIKRVLVAGKADKVTQAELARIRELFKRLKNLALHLHPHTAVLFGERKDLSEQQVEAASRVFRHATAEIGKWLERTGETLTVEQLKELLALFSRRLDLPALQQGIGLVSPIKRILVGGHAENIEGTEWAQVTESLSESFLLLFGMQVTFTGHIHEGLAKRLLPQHLLAFTNFLNHNLRRRHEPHIPVEDWEKLFEELEGTDWLPEAATKGALMSTWSWLLSRPLGFVPETIDLTMAHVQELQRHLEMWLQLYDRMEGRTTFHSDVWNEFEEVLARSRPLNWDHEGRMVFERVEQIEWSLEQKKQMLYPFVLMRWLRTAYVGEDRSTLEEEDMRVAVAEVLPLLHNFGWLKQTPITVYKRLLREADLFSLGSNGDGALDLSEAVRYVNLVVSAFQSASYWVKKAENVCGTPTAPECLRRVALQPGSGILDSMPHLRNNPVGQDERQFITYMKQAEETILNKVQTEPFGTAQLLQVWVLFQYAETFLLRFDQNASESIHLAEAMEAFPLYGPTLGRLLSSSGLPEDEVLVFFTYLMKYGETPFTQWGGLILYNYWKWNRNHWAFDSARPILMGILNQLSKL